MFATARRRTHRWGFPLDGPTRRAVVEYESYRVGAVWSAEWRPGFKLEIGAGVETERSFDFFREPRRVHGGGVGYLKLGASFSR